MVLIFVICSLSIFCLSLNILQIYFICPIISNSLSKLIIWRSKRVGAQDYSFNWYSRGNQIEFQNALFLHTYILQSLLKLWLNLAETLDPVSWFSLEKFWLVNNEKNPTCCHWRFLVDFGEMERWQVAGSLDKGI